MSKRFTRTGLTTGLICTGLALGCVGVGVSAWQVGDYFVSPTDVGGITVGAEDAEGNFLEIESARVVDDQIRFGTKVNDLGEITANADTEDLDSSFTFDFVAATGDLSGLFLSVTGTFSENLVQAAEKGYIVLPFEPGTNFNILSFDSEGQASPIDGEHYTTALEGETVTVTMSFGWGAKFAGHNPVEDEIYFGLDGAIDSFTQAYLAVGELHDLVSDASIHLEIGR